MKKVLFVCTGNTCRSPMAEALLKEYGNIDVKSAGVYAFSGSPASFQAIEVLKEKNIDFEHVSRPLTEALIEWADVVLTMTAGHKQEVLRNYSHVAQKIHTLKEYTGGNGDITDPYGGHIDIYRKTLQELEEIIPRLIQLLEK